MENRVDRLLTNSKELLKENSSEQLTLDMDLSIMIADRNLNKTELADAVSLVDALRKDLKISVVAIADLKAKKKLLIKEEKALTLTVKNLTPKPIKTEE